MKLKRVQFSIHSLSLLFKLVACNAVVLICAKSAWALPMDLNSYDPACGVIVREVGESLVIKWDTPEGSTELTLNVSGKGALVRSVAVARGKGEPAMPIQ